MAQTTVFKKLDTRLNKLKQEIFTLRSFLISIVVEDKEGDYRPEFVKEIFKAAKEKPGHVFVDRYSFLAELKRL